MNTKLLQQQKQEKLAAYTASKLAKKQERLEEQHRLYPSLYPKPSAQNSARIAPTLKNLMKKFPNAKYNIYENDVKKKENIAPTGKLKITNGMLKSNGNASTKPSKNSKGMIIREPLSPKRNNVDLANTAEPITSNVDNENNNSTEQAQVQNVLDHLLDENYVSPKMYRRLSCERLTMAGMQRRLSLMPQKLGVADVDIVTVVKQYISDIENSWDNEMVAYIASAHGKRDNDKNTDVCESLDEKSSRVGYGVGDEMLFENNSASTGNDIDLILTYDSNEEKSNNTDIVQNFIVFDDFVDNKDKTSDYVHVHDIDNKDKNDNIFNHNHNHNHNHVDTNEHVLVTELMGNGGNGGMKGKRADLFVKTTQSSNSNSDDNDNNKLPGSNGQDNGSNGSWKDVGDNDDNDDNGGNGDGEWDENDEEDDGDPLVRKDVLKTCLDYYLRKGIVSLFVIGHMIHIADNNYSTPVHVHDSSFDDSDGGSYVAYEVRLHCNIELKDTNNFKNVYNEWAVGFKMMSFKRYSEFVEFSDLLKNAFIEENLKNIGSNCSRHSYDVAATANTNYAEYVAMVSNGIDNSKLSQKVNKSKGGRYQLAIPALPPKRIISSFGRWKEAKFLRERQSLLNEWLQAVLPLQAYEAVDHVAFGSPSKRNADNAIRKAFRKFLLPNS